MLSKIFSPGAYKLEQIARRLLLRAGIGSGSGVDSSGEACVFKILTKNLKPPYCVFDVGANKGDYATLCLKALSGGGAIASLHCFEPSAPTFELLSQRFKNTDENIILNNFALGAQEQDATLYYDKQGSGLASLTKRRLDHFNISFEQSEKVHINTLEAYCKMHNIEHIHLLKLDVEGHELDVLNGALGLFAKNAIDIVTFEFGGCNIDTKTYFQDFWYFFKDKNMSIYRILPNNKLHKIPEYRELYEQFVTTNYVAMKENIRPS